MLAKNTASRVLRDLGWCSTKASRDLDFDLGRSHQTPIVPVADDIGLSRASEVDSGVN